MNHEKQKALALHEQIEIEELKAILMNLRGNNDSSAISPYHVAVNAEQWIAFRLANLLWGPL